MTMAKVLEGYRRHRSVTYRALAAEVGVEYSTLWRFMHGKACDDHTLVAIMIWMLDGDKLHGDQLS